MHNGKILASLLKVVGCGSYSKLDLGCGDLSREHLNRDVLPSGKLGRALLSYGNLGHDSFGMSVGRGFNFEGKLGLDSVAHARKASDRMHPASARVLMLGLPRNAALSSCNFSYARADWAACSPP
uniref:Uncharacterized protein n=1 Tax=Cannabis sativa TaxID=3483 RepID=A0A803PCU3_CANSA